MKRVMLDIETMGITPGCVILSIGAVCFDSAHSGAWFYSRVDLRGSIRAGYRVEADTLAWWFRHMEAGIEFGQAGGDLIEDACSRFRAFCGDDAFEVWANGSTFDNEILREAFLRCGLGGKCWERRQDRCYRTLVGMIGGCIPVDYDTVLPITHPPEWWEKVARHHALRDAAQQAAHAVKCFKYLGLSL